MRRCLILVKRLFLLIAIAAIVAFSPKEDRSVIVAGLGIRGTFEIGWSEKNLVKKQGKGKKESRVYRDCVRYRSTSRYYDELDITVYTDFHSNPREPKGDSVVAIRFGSRSNSITDRGIVINQSTRRDVYSLYGAQKDNPTSDYDIGIWFEFDYDRGRYSENDTVREIVVYIPVDSGE